jgi:hypothetical protein
MVDFNDTRGKIQSEFKNETLKKLALDLTDIIEYSANSTSNKFNKTLVESYDASELNDMLENAKVRLKRFLGEE